MLNIILATKNVNIILINGDFMSYLTLNSTVQTRDLGAKCNFWLNYSNKIYKNSSKWAYALPNDLEIKRYV